MTYFLYIINYIKTNFNTIIAKLKKKDFVFSYLDTRSPLLDEIIKTTVDGQTFYRCYTVLNVST